MTHEPSRETFEELASQHDLVPVYRRLAGDTLTPVSAFHRIDRGDGACLFESVIGGEKVGRYSFLAAEPFLQISARANEVTILEGSRRRTLVVDNPLHVLRDYVKARRAAHPASLPPFISARFGYMGYDTVRYVESLPASPPDDRDLPDLSFGFYDRMIVFDHIHKTITVVAMAHVRNAPRLQDAYDQAAARVDDTVRQLGEPAVDLPMAEIVRETRDENPADFTSNFARADFEAAVKKCVEYIHAGDIFQVVLSQRLAVPVTCSPFEIYRTLRTINPSPFMFYLRTPEVTLVGSSPEVMCRVVGKEVTVRPLAGTRPRGSTPAADAALAQELLADPKERAEHVMLVDLGRNDVGRIAEYGSLVVSELMTVERYSHVMHITSNVTGKLRPDCDAFDALQSCLPAGTVSGAPKVRAMEIIDELEPHRRGPYGGAVGYFDFSGNMDTCIALRTIVIQDQLAHVQAGAGIVADSIPANEYQETWNKALALLRALSATEARMARSRS